MFAIGSLSLSQECPTGSRAELESEIARLKNALLDRDDVLKWSRAEVKRTAEVLKRTDAVIAALLETQVQCPKVCRNVCLA